MFKKYDYIYEVYKEKSFTRAAQKLFISQPSLSAAVKSIEKKVGAPLFERKSSGVIPTQIGEEYILACKKIINIQNEFEDRLHDIYNLETGCINVGGTNYLSSYILPAVINKFKALYPKIEVSLFEAKSVTLWEMLKNREIDIIIDSFDTVPDAFSGCPLKSERILLCVPSNWEINKGLEKSRILPENIYNADINLDSIPPVSIELFRDIDFILLKSGNDMHTRATKIFEEHSIVPRVSFSVDQLNISYAMTESGIGACFQTDTFFRYSNFSDRVTLYNLTANSSARVLHVIHNKQKYVTTAMRKFIETAQEILES